MEKARKQLGDKADKIKWVVNDITEFEPDDSYDIWHDRAAFHFLNTPEQIKKYLDTARKSVTGFLIIGTFSAEGPEKCSGLSVKQYNEEQLAKAFQSKFDKICCLKEDHVTPFGTIQNFLFCRFQRI